MKYRFDLVRANGTMLTESEKHGMAELLARMSVEDLQSLAQTVTSKLLVPETSSESISMIILHTDRAADLLKRRKIKNSSNFGVTSFANRLSLNSALAIWTRH